MPELVFESDIRDTEHGAMHTLRKLKIVRPT